MESFSHFRLAYSTIGLSAPQSSPSYARADAADQQIAWGPEAKPVAVPLPRCQTPSEPAPSVHRRPRRVQRSTMAAINRPAVTMLNKIEYATSSTNARAAIPSHLPR